MAAARRRRGRLKVSTCDVPPRFPHKVATSPGGDRSRVQPSMHPRDPVRFSPSSPAARDSCWAIHLIWSVRIADVHRASPVGQRVHLSGCVAFIDERLCQAKHDASRLRVIGQGGLGSGDLASRTVARSARVPNCLVSDRRAARPPGPGGVPTGGTSGSSITSAAAISARSLPTTRRPDAVSGCPSRLRRAGCVVVSRKCPPTARHRNACRGGGSRGVANGGALRAIGVRWGQTPVGSAAVGAAAVAG